MLNNIQVIHTVYVVIGKFQSNKPNQSNDKYIVNIKGHDLHTIYEC